MATIVLGAIGAAAGGFIGGPVGAKIGLTVGVAIGSLIDQSMQKVPKQERGKIDDLRITGSGYGSLITQVWGRARIGGNIIWATKLEEQRREEEVGGKGGPTAEVVTYSYFGNFAVSICRGPIAFVQRIWAEDLLIYDRDKPTPTHYDIGIYNGTEVQLPDPLMEAHEGVGNVPAYRGMAYAVFQRLPLRKWGNRLPSMTFEVVTLNEEEVSADSIIGDLFSQAGLLPEQYDGSGAASKSVTGMVLTSRGSARDAVETLLQVLAIDITEVDGTVKVIARGGASEVTIPADDLGADFWGEGSEPVANVSVRRVPDLELPVSIELTYYGADKKYETGSQRAVRYTKGHVDDAVTVNTPLVLKDTRARQYAEYLLYAAWIEREQLKVTLPPKYLRYTPGTVMNVPVAGQSLRCRMVSQDYALFGPIEASFVRDDTNILDQTIDGGSIGTDDDELLNPETIAFIPFCSNALEDEHSDSPGYYLAAAGQEGWTGVQIYRARSGNAYRAVRRIGDSATYGTTASGLAPGTNTGAIDADDFVDVTLEAGNVETTSMDELLAGKNAALIGNEVIQFLEVEALGGSDFRLKQLLRGQRGTDYAWDAHGAGERFLLLESATVFRVDVPRDLIGKTLKFKAITESENLADVAPVNLLITGQELKPWSPVNIVGTRDGSLHLTVEWVRRARKNNEIEDGEDVELDEPYERYDVEIWDATFTTLKRTISGLTAPTAIYTATEQTSDFGATQASVSVLVYQLGDFKPGTTTSRMRGYPGQAVV